MFPHCKEVDVYDDNRRSRVAPCVDVTVDMDPQTNGLYRALDKCVLLMRMHIHTPVHDTTFEPRITVFSTTSLLSSSLPLTIYTSEKRKERARKKEGKGRERKKERERFG